MGSSMMEHLRARVSLAQIVTLRGVVCRSGFERVFLFELPCVKHSPHATLVQEVREHSHTHIYGERHSVHEFQSYLI